MPDTIRRTTGTILIILVSLLLLLALPAGAEYQADTDVVTDSETGLMWMQAAGTERDWQTALAYCQDLNHHGHSDWRLPDLNELESLVDYTRYTSAIDPVFSCRSSIYWSSSPYAGNSGYAWLVSFYYGSANYYSKDDKCYVRCVRGGP